ncbi:zf-HC2 domain-containing protein [candidate division WOR-3 bacterium]|nr:zf-HC2 domain-containing protein [candidate division WOR-3 bacterium]
MKGCSWVKKRLIDRVEGELNAAETRVFDNHIKECPACKKEYETTRRLYNSLKDDVRFPDTAYWDSLPRRIRQNPVPLRRQGFWFKKLIPVLIPVIAACMVIVLLSRRPAPTIEMTVPVSALLEDEDIAMLALQTIVHDDMLQDLMVIEEFLPLDIDEMIREMTLQERQLFIELIVKEHEHSSKYGKKRQEVS